MRPASVTKLAILAGWPLAALLCSAAAPPPAAGGASAAPVLSPPDMPTHAVDARTLGDPLYREPYVDVDEWRDAPVRHRYIHGGFKGTPARFSFYFPPKARYQGRFFQKIAPIPGSEDAVGDEPAGAGNDIGFAAASGGYFVYTNGGGAFDLGRGDQGASDVTISAYRANAAAARYSRVVAARVYGESRRVYGYAYGGSGGAYRTIGAAENTQGVWDGTVPFVMGTENAIPSVFSVKLQVQRLLGDKLADVVDAVEPGGSGNPYATLDPEQAAALREATRFGIPLRSWFGYRTMGIQGFVAIYQVQLALDPTYFTDFWTKPGYLGFAAPASLTADRIQYATKIAAVLTPEQSRALVPEQIFQRGGVNSAFRTEAPAPAFRLAGMPPQVPFLGGDLLVKSGAAAGERISLKLLKGDAVAVGVANPDIVAKLRPGDAVVIDNSAFLAAETYHRHQVPGAGYPGYTAWDQFKGPDDKPLYPQRPFLMGPMIQASAVGGRITGDVHGKMIVVQSLWDRDTPPWSADWYRRVVEGRLGAARAAASFRLYYTDHALHGDERGNEDPSRIVEYTAELQQALRDVSAWAERGVQPPDSTRYTIVDNQTVVPASAAERRGIQPVALLQANGAVRAEVRAGAPVRFTATGETPPGGGAVVAIDWDFEGTGSFASAAAAIRPARRVSASAIHVFDRPGTYFAGVRVTAQVRPGDAEPYARMQNLDRVRVVVR